MLGIVHVYQETPGNWVVDTGGTREKPGKRSERHEWGPRWEQALLHACMIAEGWRLQFPMKEEKRQAILSSIRYPCHAEAS